MWGKGMRTCFTDSSYRSHDDEAQLVFQTKREENQIKSNSKRVQDTVKIIVNMIHPKEKKKKE